MPKLLPSPAGGRCALLVARMDEDLQDIPGQETTVDLGRLSEELVTSIQDGHMQMRTDMENLFSAWQLRIEGSLQKQLVASFSDQPPSFIRSIDKESDPATPAIVQILASGEDNVATAEQQFGLALGEVTLEPPQQATSGSPETVTANLLVLTSSVEAERLSLDGQISLGNRSTERSEEMDVMMRDLSQKLPLDGDTEDVDAEHDGIGFGHSGTQQFFDDLVREMASSWLHRIAHQMGAKAAVHRMSMMVHRKHLPQCIGSTCARIVVSSWFTFLVTSLILFNSVLVAVSADEFAHACWKYFESGDANKSVPSSPEWMDILDIVFTSLFSMELLVRLGDEEFQFFISGDVGWNLFDLIVVISAWTEVGFSLSGNTGSSSNFLRVFRILRVLRSVRIVKVLRMMREMRLIMLCLIHGMAPLLWALVCLAMIIFIFAINFLSGVSSFLLWAADKSEHDKLAIALNDDFGGFEKCFATLLYIITGGEDWGEYHRALGAMSEYNWAYKWTIIAYVVIMFFGVLNVITAIFVEGSLSKAQADRELSVAAENKKTKGAMGELMKLFRSIDHDQSNTLTWEEWKTFVARKDAKSLLALLELDAGKSHEIFRLVDVDESNEIDMQEFVMGCMQLRGGAKNVDIETMLRANRKLMTKSAENMEKVNRNIKKALQERSDKSEQLLNQILSALQGPLPKG